MLSSIWDALDCSSASPSSQQLPPCLPLLPAKVVTGDCGGVCDCSLCCQVDGSHWLSLSVMHSDEVPRCLRWLQWHILCSTLHQGPYSCTLIPGVVQVIAGTAPRVAWKRLSLTATFGLQERLNFRRAQMMPKARVGPLACHFQPNAVSKRCTPPKLPQQLLSNAPSET